MRYTLMVMIVMVIFFSHVCYSETVRKDRCYKCADINSVDEVIEVMQDIEKNYASLNNNYFLKNTKFKNEEIIIKDALLQLLREVKNAKLSMHKDFTSKFNVNEKLEPKVNGGIYSIPFLCLSLFIPFILVFTAISNFIFKLKHVKILKEIQVHKNSIEGLRVDIVKEQGMVANILAKIKIENKKIQEMIIIKESYHRQLGGRSRV